MNALNQLAGNWICWVMIVIAWVGYQQIFMLYNRRQLLGVSAADKEARLERQRVLPTVLIASLPLLGLLGTISGLQFSFRNMMTSGVDSQLVSGGIADALLTTQLGLILAIPGWLALMAVGRQRPQVAMASEESAHG